MKASHIPLALLSLAAATFAADNDAKAQKALEKRLAEEGAIKAKFAYSFNDISDKLVTVSCESRLGKSSGSGFIAELDGKTYLFTNQHVILGSETISFKTATGRTLRPRSVELSAERDIARLLLADETGLPVTKKLSMGGPVGVFGNSEGGGVATELYGKVTGIGADKVEVSAGFVSGNSGSPVLDLNRNVIGIASYVTYSTGETKDNKPRRFCYRLTDCNWGAVRWKKYNEKYGKLYRDYEQLIDSIFEAADSWYGDPFSRMFADDHKDSGLQKWSSEHNLMVKRIERTLGTKITQHELDNTNRRIRKDMSDSAEALTKVCRDRARQMRLLSEQRELSGFLRDEFIRFSDRMEYAATHIERYGKKLAEHNYFYFEKT
ncbi:Putative serine protease HtrA [Pontiella desulfatans]|uniref:Serine protease HtrA n=1 Tax=Pontiella desulfatans TaxID=2750659 RepID=A0A6C2U8Q7_PONDE|nr:serine protease [Pontiella desulfatans]VGO16107.1 Putative serine protease HtrA [Pontiella desulfatans]